MEEILSKVASLASDQLNFEELGDAIYSLDFVDVDYEAYLDPNRSENDYCRKVLHEGPLECVLLFWPPGTESAIHYHRGFWGYVAVLEGIAENVEYVQRGETLEEGMTVRVLSGGIIREPDDIIHKIQNGSNINNLVTLHFYYPPINTFKGMKIYELETGREGTLGEKAKSASWKQAEECFEEIQENAFEFMPFDKAKNFPSHKIFPIIPKPDCDQISSMLAGYYNEQAEQYDNFDTQHKSRQRYTNRINELIASDIHDKHQGIKSKLAIACGTGRREMNIKEIISGDYEVMGIDISADMCQIAEERGIETIHGDWLNTEIPQDKQFEVITFLYAFGHITTHEKRRKVLEKVFNHLEPGGSFYVDVFNLYDKSEWGPKALDVYNRLQLYRSDYEEGDVFYKKLEGDEIAYLHYFREEEITNLLIEAGFSEIDVTHVGYVQRSGEIQQEKDLGALFVKARKARNE